MKSQQPLNLFQWLSIFSFSHLQTE